MTLGKWVIKYRWLVLAATLVVAFAAASGGRHLGFTNDYRYFFGGENPQLLAFESIQDTYSKNDNVLFALAPRDGRVFTNRTLAAVAELTEAAWLVPFSSRVDSVTNFQHTRADGDDLVVEDLVPDAGGASDADLEGVKAIALAEPLLLNRIVNPDATVTGVNVTINLLGERMDEVPEVAAYVRAVKADFASRYPDIDFYLTGTTMMNNSFPEASRDDMSRLVPLMLLVIIVVIYILIRSVAATVATTVVIIISALTGMGIAGWIGIPISAPSAVAPTIIMTLAVADSIHVLVTVVHEMQRGRTKFEAIEESLRINLQPVFLTSITTALGFLTMNFSDAPPFNDLGNIVAVGVVGAFFYSIFFLPAMIAILPMRFSTVTGEKRHLMERLGEVVVARRGLLFFGVLGVMVVLTAGMLKIELDDLFVNYFDERYEFRRHTDFVTEKMTGIYTIEYSLGAGGEGGVAEPEYLEKLEEFARWFEEQDGVMHVFSVTDIMKRLNRNMHGDDDAYYRLPDTRELAAQYLLLYEMSLPFGLDLTDRINIDKSATRLTVTMRSLRTKEILALEERAVTWLRDNAPDHMFGYGASPAIMFAHIGEQNIRSMLTGTAVALVLISAILAVALRSVKIGVISLVPNLMPALMAFGLWGYLVGQVGLAVSVVTAMSLGIVVDDTVHFLSKYLRARRERGSDVEDAVRYSFHTVGTALWTTSLILIAGFFVLTFSGFKINADMGLLTAIVIAIALVVDFLFLPPLLMWLDRVKLDGSDGR